MGIRGTPAIPTGEKETTGQLLKKCSASGVVQTCRLKHQRSSSLPLTGIDLKLDHHQYRPGCREGRPHPAPGSVEGTCLGRTSLRRDLFSASGPKRLSYPHISNSTSRGVLSHIAVNAARKFKQKDGGYVFFFPPIFFFKECKIPEKYEK